MSGEASKGDPFGSDARQETRLGAGWGRKAIVQILVRLGEECRPLEGRHLEPRKVGAGGNTSPHYFVAPA